MKKPCKLTPKQRRFAKEYLIDLNATQAAIRAGYAKKAAFVTGCRLLKNAKVQDEIQKGVTRRDKKTELTQEFIVRELMRVAQVDMKEFVEWGPDGVTLIESDKVDGSLVKEVSQCKDSKQIKVHDKMKALELLGRHKGLFKDEERQIAPTYITVIKKYGDSDSGNKSGGGPAGAGG